MPMKSQAMAIITVQKFVAAVVEDFRKKYPNWNKTVPSLLEKKKKKRKLNVETASGTNKPLKKSLKSLNDNDDEENSDEENDKSDLGSDGRSDVSNSDNEEESVLSKSENEEDEEGEEDMSSDKGREEEEGSEKEEENENHLESEGEKNELLSSSEEFNNNSDIDTKKPIIKSSPLKSLKRHVELPQPELVSSKLTKFTVVCNKKSNKVGRKNDEVKDSSEHSPAKKSLKQRVVKEKPKVVDPFFMTTTNEEYFTSQVPTVSDDNESKWKSKSDDYKHSKFDSFSKLNIRKNWSNRDDDWKRNKFSNQDSQYNRKPFVPSSEKTSFNNGSEPFNIFTNRKERRKALHQPPQETKVEKLHPSWEAKKKQTSIASFQGKKITFD